MGIELVLLIAWLFTHGIYRGVVGTYCAATKTVPPWVQSRQERLTNREIRRADRREALASKRTARSFAHRIWGNFWEDCNNALEERRARHMNTPDAPAVPGEPIVTIDADQAADWARNLGAKVVAAAAWVRSTWSAWWLPSRRRCAWTYLTDTACGRRIKDKDATYCPEHQEDAGLGHCLKIEADVQCPRPREGHYPFCSEHLDEEEAERAAATRGDAAAAPNIGTLDTPDAPTLAVAEPPTTQAPTVEPGKYRPTCVWPGEPPCTAEPADGRVLCPHHCDVHEQQLQEPGRCQVPACPNPVAVGCDRWCPEHDFQPAHTPPEPEAAAVPVEDGPNCPAPVNPSGMTCGQPMERVPGGWVCHLPHNPVDPTPAPGATAEPEVPVEPAPEVPPQRPLLRVVPNTEPQGDTTVTAPSAEITNVQNLDGFADKVIAHGTQDWPQMLESAESQMGNAGLTNDPALTGAIGQMREAAGMFAAAGEALKNALNPHRSAAEQISGLGNTAADKTATYQNQ